MRGARSTDAPGDCPDEGTRIDLHAKFAIGGLLMGSLPTTFYYLGFEEFGASELVWKLCFVLQVLASIVLFAHYLVNRNARRLWPAGFAALCMVVPIWLFMGSCWIFYFTFAPMPYWIRAVALVPCCVAAVRFPLLVWKDYAREITTSSLVESAYRERGSVLVYGTASEAIIERLKQRSPFSRLHLLAVTIFGPFSMAFALTAPHGIHIGNGPHAVFLVASFFSFPVSQWLLGYLSVRIAFFQIYLPLKLERETGKKVILGP